MGKKSWLGRGVNSNSHSLSHTTLFCLLPLAAVEALIFTGSATRCKFSFFSPFHMDACKCVCASGDDLFVHEASSSADFSPLVYSVFFRHSMSQRAIWLRLQCESNHRCWDDKTRAWVDFFTERLYFQRNGSIYLKGFTKRDVQVYTTILIRLSN